MFGTRVLHVKSHPGMHASNPGWLWTRPFFNLKGSLGDFNCGVGVGVGVGEPEKAFEPSSTPMVGLGKRDTDCIIDSPTPA